MLSQSSASQALLGRYKDFISNAASRLVNVANSWQLCEEFWLMILKPPKTGTSKCEVVCFKWFMPCFCQFLGEILCQSRLLSGRSESSDMTAPYFTHSMQFSCIANHRITGTQISQSPMIFRCSPTYDAIGSKWIFCTWGSSSLNIWEPWWSMEPWAGSFRIIPRVQSSIPNRTSYQSLSNGAFLNRNP